MSRYPFVEYAREYMDSMHGYYSEATYTRYLRRYERMAREMVDHYNAGKISTTSPKRMTAEDVRYHLTYRKGLGHSASEYGHEVTTMIVLFDYCENPAVRTCLRKYPLLRPVNKHVRLGSLSGSEYDRILSRMAEVSGSDDYRLVRSYAMLAVFLGCGPRTKELRFIDVNDLDTREWVLDIIHVKGEDTYGQPRTVPVPPGFRPVISRYLELRELHNPSRSPALFPPSRGSTRYLVGNSIRSILSIALDDLHLSVDPRTLRRSFGQNYLDSGIDSIESVSVLMGHATTQTTEYFYARRRNQKALEEARKTFVGRTGENDDFDSKNEVWCREWPAPFLIQILSFRSIFYRLRKKSPVDCITVNDSSLTAPAGSALAAGVHSSIVTFGTSAQSNLFPSAQECILNG